MKYRIFHHYDDDGKAAAALFYLGYLKRKGFISIDCKDLKFIKIADYSAVLDIKTENNDNLTQVFLDYSFSNGANLELVKEFLANNDPSHFIWIDHHKTSVEIYNAFKDTFLAGTETLISPLCSGSMLTWLYCNMSKEVAASTLANNVSHGDVAEYMHSRLCLPTSMLYIDDYDTTGPGMYRYTNTQKFHIGLDASSTTVNDFIKLFQTGVDDEPRVIKHYTDLGTTLLDYVNTASRKWRNVAGFEVTDRFGHSWYVLNGVGNGLDFGPEYETHDICCIYSFNGEKWKYSLYSNKENVDCSEIAAIFGGGGHKGAAGFTADILIFARTLDTDLAKADVKIIL